MSIVKIEFCDFKNPGINNKYNIKNQVIDHNVSKSKLLWSFLNFGKKRGAFISPIEIKYKSNYLDLMFDFTTPILSYSLYASTLETSEKNCLSFYVGMMFGQIAAHDFFGIKRLYHTTKKHFTDSSTTCDFISQNKHGYFAFECKGTMHKYIKTIKKKAVSQLTSLSRINGQVPLYKIATIQHTIKNEINLKVIDPTNGENIKINQSIDANQFSNDLYEMIVKNNNYSYKKYENNVYVEIAVDNIRIGVKDKGDTKISNEEISETLDINFSNSSFFLGDDGVYVIT